MEPCPPVSSTERILSCTGKLKVNVMSLISLIGDITSKKGLKAKKDIWIVSHTLKNWINALAVSISGILSLWNNQI